MVNELQTLGRPRTKVLRDLASCAWQLGQIGADRLPTWAGAVAGAVPPAPSDDIDSADFDRGWQCY
eukprot:4637938-Pyramimonas_sp.AAC.1